MPFAPIQEALAELRAGRMIILCDDEARENEGDLVLPAQFVTPEAITFMLKQAKGYLCLSLTEHDCDRLELHPQSPLNTTVRGTAFTVSVDLHPRHGGTTGVSARERAACVRMLIDPATTPADFVRPGHVNPLRARAGGVLVRTGQTEGSIDLCRLAGLTPAALIIEIMRDDGEMARLPDLTAFAKEHNLKMCSVAQVIQHRLARESLVHRLEPHAGLPVVTAAGPFHLLAYESLVDPQPHVVLSLGGVGLPDDSGAVLDQPEPVLVRMHRRSVLGDVFWGTPAAPGPRAQGAHAGSQAVSSGQRLHAAMRLIQSHGKGVVVYLRPEPDGDSLEHRLTRVRRPLAHDHDTPDLHALYPAAHQPLALPAEHSPRAMRDFGVGCQILRSLGLSKIRLISGSDTDRPGLEAFGLHIVERVHL
ncbi:MAG: 3,4-dihydroxy-2-butanone-4-phosphate synthase [Isosphaera sp.]|nr:3,4-dihydroxy-2-butanone-4-phosphate synthase [Isosphaera sp.]